MVYHARKMKKRMSRWTYSPFTSQGQTILYSHQPDLAVTRWCHTHAYLWGLVPKIIHRNAGFTQTMNHPDTDDHINHRRVDPDASMFWVHLGSSIFRSISSSIKKIRHWKNRWTFLPPYPWNSQFLTIILQTLMKTRYLMCAHNVFHGSVDLLLHRTFQFWLWTRMVFWHNFSSAFKFKSTKLLCAHVSTWAVLIKAFH